ncbi:MAG: hypothetical protein ACK5ZS_00090 [bacterium]|jgi:hypothetical protein
MATRAATITPIETFKDHAHVVRWTGLLNGDDGSPIEMPGSSDRSIQFTGTFGTGGTIALEGSNDGVNYVVLTDPQGNNISKTAASIEAVTELTRYIRPRVTAGDGSTNLVATLLVKR